MEDQDTLRLRPVGRPPKKKRTAQKLLLFVLFLVLVGSSAGGVIYWKRDQLKQSAKELFKGASQAVKTSIAPTFPPANPTQTTTGKTAGLLSRGVPAFSSNASTPAWAANSGDFDHPWRSVLTPAWLAYDLSRVPAAERNKVLLVWYNQHGAYDHTLIKEPAYNNLKDYVIETNTAAGGGSAPTSGWVEKAKVTGNTYHSRQHVIDMQGANWIRIMVTASDGSEQNMDASISMDIYDAQKVLTDDWIFYGDSLTAGGMLQTTQGDVPSFAQLINQKLPDHFPVQEGGGTGYLLSYDGTMHIDEWLDLFPGKYVGLSYGTNDAWNCVAPEKFYNNYVALVQAVISAGKIPLVPKIPWSKKAQIQQCAPALNAKIDQLYRSYPQVVHGPDFWTSFQAHPDYILQDEVHFTPQGYGEYRKLWAETVLKSVYKA
jgi:lysophospholipase L1-like esterase